MTVTSKFPLAYIVNENFFIGRVNTPVQYNKYGEEVTLANVTKEDKLAFLEMKKYLLHSGENCEYFTTPYRVPSKFRMWSRNADYFTKYGQPIPTRRGGGKSIRR